MKKNKKRIKNPILKLFIKISILTLIISLGIIYSDVKGYFNSDDTNNHTIKKWNSFYELTENKVDIDIMLFGNSHLYTGINPKNLSLNLGATAFLFASPGTNIADSYFSLKEAVKKNKPKLVIVETYGMNNFNPYKLDDEELSDQFKSFSARKDFLTKLISTPYLFSVDNYLYAWSTTLRNHTYIFTNRKQLKINKEKIDKPYKWRKEEDKLYLGRFVRFTTGLKEDVLEKYETQGAAVNGKDYSYNKYTELYVEKIVDFCKDEDIELMFLTLPMYEKHVSNYDVWKEKLGEILNQYPNKWLDLQTDANYQGFDTNSFENTYSKNQHMTYNGSLLASYKLADYVRDSVNIELPARNTETNWENLFYGEEGYFENYNPRENDKNNKVLCSNKKLQNIKLNSCLLLKPNNKNHNVIIAKVNKDTIGNTDYQNFKIRVFITFEKNGKDLVAQVDLIYDKFHQTEDEVIFKTFVKPLKFKEVVDGGIILKKN